MKLHWHIGGAYLLNNGKVGICKSKGLFSTGRWWLEIPPSNSSLLEGEYLYDDDGNCLDCVKELTNDYKIIGPAKNPTMNPAIYENTEPKTVKVEDLKPAERKMYDALGSDQQKKVFLERQATYGSVVLSHKQIGRMWAAKLTNYLGIQIDDLPGYIVALMMVDMKTQRASRVYHNDNFVDAHNYLEFADKMQEAGE